MKVNPRHSPHPPEPQPEETRSKEHPARQNFRFMRKETKYYHLPDLLESMKPEKKEG